MTTANYYFGALPDSSAAPSTVIPIVVDQGQATAAQSGPALATADDIKDLARTLLAEMQAEQIEESNTSVASHDEEEDVRLAEQAITFLRQLLAREALDGQNIWQLQDLVQALQAVNMVKWNEEDDVLQENLEQTDIYAASTDDQLLTGGEDMAFSEEARAELNEAVASANAPVVEAVQAMTTSMASLIDLLTQQLTPPAVAEAPVAEVVAETTEETVETPVAEAQVETPEVEAVAEVETPEVEAEAAAPPFTKKKKGDDDEEEEEEDSEAGETQTEEATAEASEAEGEDDAWEPTAEEFTAAASDSMRANSASGLRSFTVNSEAGRRQYLEGVAKANKLPVGVVSDTSVTADANPSKDDLIKGLVNIFRRN
jgi:hypothetical protein